MSKLIIILSIIFSVSACATKLDPIEEQKRRAELIEHCKQLKKDMVAMKGKPIRRNAATQTFNSECTLRTDPDSIY